MTTSPTTNEPAAPDDHPLVERAVAVALDLHRSTLDSKLLNRMDRWDIFATRLQSAAESTETLGTFLEAFARKLEVGSLYGPAIAMELRRDSAPLIAMFRDESIAVVALTRVALEEKREARKQLELSMPDTEVTTR